MRPRILLFALALTACEKTKSDAPAPRPQPQAQAGGTITAPVDAGAAIVAPADAGAAMVAAADAAPAVPLDATPAVKVAKPAEDLDCAVRYDLHAEPTDDGFLLTATATAIRDVTIDLLDTCPGGPIAFTGLPSGYDLYGTCVMGRCAGQRDRTETIAAGGTLMITEVELRTAGGSCNKPLPAGTRRLSFKPPPVVGGGEACGPGNVKVKLGGKPRRDEPDEPEVALDAGAAQPRCKPMPACGLGCPNGGGFAKDEHGCSICACAEDDRPDHR